MKLKVSLLLNMWIHIHPLTFVAEVLHLYGSPSVASTHYLSVLSRNSLHAVLLRPHLFILSMASVIIKQMKAGKSHKLV